MTDREIIKWAKQNLQEVQKLKEYQVVTKKLRKNCKKIWWIEKVVVTLQCV